MDHHRCSLHRRVLLTRGFFRTVSLALVLRRNTNPASYRILFGLHDRLSQESWVISRNVRRIIVHPSYVSQNFRNDIALMQLSVRDPTGIASHLHPFSLSLSLVVLYRPRWIRTRSITCLSAFPMPLKRLPVKLGTPLDGEPRTPVSENTLCTSATFLSFRFCSGGSIERYLLEVATPIVTDSECQRRYSTGMISTAIQICSGGNKQGACQVERSIDRSRHSCFHSG